MYFLALSKLIRNSPARQALQHYLWKDGIGYLLHPSIPTKSENLKVAEIGVGTGQV